MSCRPSKFTPLTTRPFLTSRQGMMRFGNHTTSLPCRFILVQAHSLAPDRWPRCRWTCPGWRRGSAWLAARPVRPCAAMPPEAVISSPGMVSSSRYSVHVGALHRAVPGNISGDDGLDAHPGAAAAERHARLGGDFLPAIHGYQAVFHVDAHGNLCAVLLRHLVR